MIGRLAIVGILMVAHSAAFAEGQAVGVKAGALGLGVEYTYALNDRVSFRAGLNGSELGFDREESGIEYDFDLVWDSLSLTVDFHPLTTALRVSGGLLSNDNRLEGVSRPTGNITIGNMTYTPAQVGTLASLVSFDATAPFAGVGWDWSRDEGFFGMSFDIGVVSQGAPQVTLTGNGTVAGDPSFQADIQAEAVELADSLDDFDLVPYLTLGFVFRF
ncbi:MAG TPA: hypothetical protein VJA26_00700 [Gammaproteobacteria bacterium]|nr:hypothetical protein [Gammaproteobacteria bacterium]